MPGPLAEDAGEPVVVAGIEFAEVALLAGVAAVAGDGQRAECWRAVTGESTDVQRRATVGNSRCCLKCLGRLPVRSAGQVPGLLVGEASN